MGMINYEGIFNRGPDAFQTGVSRFGDVLDAILERRRKKEQFDQEMALRQREQERLETNDAQDYYAKLRAQEAAQEAAAQKLELEKAAAQEKRQDRNALAIKDVAAMAGAGQEAAIPGYLGARGMSLRPKEMNPMDLIPSEAPQPSGLPGILGMPYDQAAQMAPEAEIENKRKALEGKQVIDFGEGETADFDTQALGPEAHAQKIQQRLMGLGLDPELTKRLATQTAAAASSGTVKPGAEYATVIGPELRDIAAEKRAQIAAQNHGRTADTSRDRFKLQAATNFGSEEARWEKNQNLDKLTDTYDRFQEMNAGIRQYKEKGDVIGQRQALYAAARYITGPGVLTENEYGNTVRGTGGAWASALSKLQKFEDGKISNQEAAAIEKFVTNANGALKQRAIKQVRNFDVKYGPKSYWSQNVPEEVAAQRGALMQRFGISPEELIEKGKGKPNLKALMDEATRD